MVSGRILCELTGKRKKKYDFLDKMFKLHSFSDTNKNIIFPCFFLPIKTMQTSARLKTQRISAISLENDKNNFCIGTRDSLFSNNYRIFQPKEQLGN